MKKSHIITVIFCLILFVVGIGISVMYIIENYFRDEQENEFFNSFCENGKDIQNFEDKEEQTKEYKNKYIVTLNRYIYDGISGYVAFSVQSKDGSEQELDKFGLSDPNSSEAFYFGNSARKNMDERKTMKGKEKMIFINSNLIDCRSAEDGIAKNNNIYLVDNSDNAQLISFPLKISTDYFEARGENFTVRVSPIQVFFMSKKKNTIHDITVVYEDGDQMELLKDYKVMGEFLGDLETRNNEEGIEMYYSIRKNIDFDNIKEIEVKWSTGKTAVLERVKKEQASLVQ